jgi:hypothetical protein
VSSSYGASAEGLRRAWEAKPADVTAAVAWSKAQARSGDRAGAAATLDEAAHAACPAPLTGGREAAASLNALISARFEGGAQWEEARGRGLWGWAPRSLGGGWRVPADAGWVWRVAHMCADRGQVIAQQAAASAYARARLVAMETATGRAQWSAARDGSVGDVRFWGDDALLILWWGREGATLEVRRRDTGQVEAQATVEGACWRRSLVTLGPGRVGLLAGGDGEPARVGVVEVSRMGGFSGSAARWEPLLDGLALGRALTAYAPRHGAPTASGLGRLGSLLGLPYEVLTLWRDTCGDEHLVFAWLIEYLRGEQARMHNRLWRVRGEALEEVTLPERWRHEPVAPRFYRVGRGWVGTLQGQQLRVERGALGPQVFPLGPVSGALPDIWTLRDDATQAEALRMGHAGAHDAVITTGGAWWQVRSAPARLSGYAVAAQGVVKQRVSQPLPSVSAEVSASQGTGWGRPPPLAALHVVPLGPWLLRVCPSELACDGVG